jgi:hypothetical protein
MLLGNKEEGDSHGKNKGNRYTNDKFEAETYP